MRDEIVVMHQPIATVDEVIAGWAMEELVGIFPGCVFQRDLFSGGDAFLTQCDSSVPS